MELKEETDALKRIFMATECRTQMELAELLGVKQSSISDAKKRNAIPAQWLIKLLRLKNINPEWILTGQGAFCLGPAVKEDSAKIMYLRRTRPPRQCTTQELVSELVRRALLTIESS